VVIMPKDGTMETALRVGLHMETNIKDIFVDPNRMELEKGLGPAILKGPKKYAAIFNVITNRKAIKDIWMDPIVIERKKFTKGDESVRRDSCLWVSLAVGKCQELLLSNPPPDLEEKLKADWAVNAAVAHAIARIAALQMGRVDFFQLICSRQLKTEPENYASKPVHVNLAITLARRDPALAPVPGDRIPYVVIRVNKQTKSSEAGEDPRTAWDEGKPLDTDAYLRDHMMKPLTRLFAPVFAPGIMLEKVPKKDAIPNAERLAMVARNKRKQEQIYRKVAPNLFVGRHMREKRVEIGQAAFTHFLPCPTCIQCRRTMPTSGLGKGAALCAKCAVDYLPAALADNLQALEEARAAFAALWSTCQACMGVSFAQPITCPNTDCHVYWERRLAQRQTRRYEDMGERLGVNLDSF